jgi:hypothetical protein
MITNGRDGGPQRSSDDGRESAPGPLAEALGPRLASILHESFVVPAIGVVGGVGVLVGVGWWSDRAAGAGVVAAVGRWRPVAGSVDRGEGLLVFAGCPARSGAGGQRPQAGKGGDELAGPGPCGREMQRALACGSRQAPGDVQQPVAQALGRKPGAVGVEDVGA